METDRMTLTEQELDELNKAYQALYNIISNMPSFLGDFFSERDDYLNVEKWQCLLNGEEFNLEDYE